MQAGAQTQLGLGGAQGSILAAEAGPRVLQGSSWSGI